MFILTIINIINIINIFLKKREDYLIIKKDNLELWCNIFLIGFLIYLFSDFITYNSKINKLFFGSLLEVYGLNIYMVVFSDLLTELFILLTYVIIIIALTISYNSILYRIKEYNLLISIIGLILIYVFMIMDIFFFFILFEVSLIPIFMIIGIWGSLKKIAAAYYLYFFTLFGSFFMLFGLLLIYNNMYSFNYMVIGSSNLGWSNFSTQLAVFYFILLAFGIKIPIYPFHIWLPKAHVEAPTAGSVILAAILLKIGSYGILRFLINILEKCSMYNSMVVIMICLISVLYSSFVILRQIDLKKIVAYSSVGHMNFLILGLFLNNIIAIEGAFFLMVSHAFVSSALFFTIGCLYDRYKTRFILYLRGLYYIMPLFSFFYFIYILANLSFPGSSNFIGEYLVLLGFIYTDLIFGILVILLLFFPSVYSFWMYVRIIFGTISNGIYKYSDLNRIEFIISFFFMFLIIVFGVCPNLLLGNMIGN